MAQGERLVVHPRILATLVILTFVGSVDAFAFDEVFYCVYQADDCVEPAEAIRIEKEDIGDLLAAVAAGERNFIGFVDSAGTTLQFYVDAIDEIWVDIPVPAKKGSFGKTVSEDEFRSLVMTLEPPFENYTESLGLRFRRW